jgi:hypothetical protein
MNRKYLGCKVEGCTGQHRNHGYCQKHWYQVKNETLGVTKEEKICSAPGCNRKHYCKGLCAAHYQRYKKIKDSEAIDLAKLNKDIRVSPKTKCSIEGCEKDHWAKGFCGTHYAAHRKSEGVYKENNEYSKGNLTFEYADRTNWSLSIKQVFGDKCSVCGWNKASCDVHHIFPVNEGGKNILSNGIVLCPSDHKLADIGILTRDELQSLNKKAIDSLKSSEELT